MNRIIAELHAKWRAAQVPLNPGASASQLSALRSLLGVDLPEDVREFYEAANGMVDYESAGHSLVSFWSTDRICKEADVATTGDALGPVRNVAFADVLIHSWCFRFRVRADGRVSVGADGAPWELAQFSLFLERYLRTPSDLGID